jgi:hypothetical protein
MKRIKLIIGMLIVLFACITFYGFFIEPEYLGVTHLWPDNPVLSDKLKGKIAVQLSDIHIKKIGTLEKKVLSLLDEIKPDFIFLTGDFVKWGGNYEPALSFLSRLKAKTGIYAVMGDYDYSNSRKSCLFCHEKGTGEVTKRYSIMFLRNTRTDIVSPEGKVSITGIDDNNEDKAIVIVGANIVLGHSPLSFDKIESEDEVLMLCGDTHGGQIPLPSWLWDILGYEKNARYNHGFFKESKKAMYVSRGIGTSHIRFRLFRRPEVVVLHF